MRASFPALTALLIFRTALGVLGAQEPLLDELPALRDKAMVLQITTKIAENSQEVWNAYNSKVTIPGRPVSIKLVGENLIVAIQFTPYIRDGKYALVAQSQIWINIPEKGMSYKTSTHSLPMDFGEPILFFPLGSNSAAALGNPHIELLLTMYRYGEEPPAGESTKETKPGESAAEASTGTGTGGTGSTGGGGAGAAAAPKNPGPAAPH
ncbi:hypothetical protein AGMMS50230_04660 [Spirochaetia bacterium]|nr:hypothetical protein AGMMS50230_04660 [Spirochaetia bacterium]